MITIIEDSDIKEAQKIAEEYFLLTIDADLMKQIIKSSVPVKSELMYGSLGDTTARDYLIDAIVEYLMPKSNLHWPMNCDSDEYTKGFYEALVAACKAHDIVFNGAIQ